MKSVKVKYLINQPDISDYNLCYPKMPCNSPQKERIFEIISNPDNIQSALTITEATGSSPILFYEKKFQAAIKAGEINPLGSHEKQFAGTATCVVMESNGWKKTGKKQRYSKGIFTSAELYVKK